MLVVVARYVVSEGHADTVARLLQANAEASREEPGCLEFTVHVDVSDPRRILLYEEYTDEESFQAHRKTAHFRDIVEAQVVPLLDERSWSRLAPVPAEDE